MTPGEIAEYEIRLRDLFSGKLDAIEQRMNQFENKVNNTGNIAAGVFGGIMLERAASKAIDLLQDASDKIVTLGVNMERTRISFTTLFQSGSEFADLMISKFQKFAQETPFSTGDVLKGARMLTAYRYAAEDIIPVMKQLGDITSGLNLNFQDVVWLVGHTKSIGYMDRRILREFTLRGIGIDEYIEKTKGITHKEFESQIRNRQIVYKDIARALEAMTNAGGQFYNLNEKLSKSVGGRWERLKDTLEIIGTRMGEQLLPMLSGWLDQGFETINKWQNIDMSGTIANFHAVESAVKNIFNLLSDVASLMTGGNNPFDRISQDWRSAAHVMAQSALLGRISIQSMKDLLSHPTDLRYRSPELIELQRQFREQNEAYQMGEKNLAGSKNKFVSDEASRRMYMLNDLYNGQHTGFRYVGKKGNGIGEEEEGSSQGGIEKISSGTRNITVNITKLIETVNFIKSYENSEHDLRDMITKALIAEVNNVNIVAG